MAPPLPFAGVTGEMAKRVRAFDWATTPLGPIERWPAEVRAAVGLALASPIVASVAVGPERRLIYNDAAASLYGAHHPAALARPLADTFESYPAVAPLYDQVFRGEAVTVRGQPLAVGTDGGGEVFDAYLTPVFGADGTVIAAHMAGFEVGASLRAQTALHESEERQAFLLRLSDALRAERGVEAVGDRAVRLIAERLGVDRVYLVTLAPDDDTVIVTHETRRPDLAALKGSYRSSDFPNAIKEILDRTIVYGDVRSDERLTALDRASFAALDAVGFIAASIRRGREAMIWAAGAITTRPRSWTATEVSLFEDAVERTWAAVERARAEAALRASEEERRSLIAEMNEGFCLLEVILDEAGNGTDYRFLETNPAFVRQGGFDPAGRLMSEIAPIEPVWPAAYGRVATTGVPERIVDSAAAFGRLYDVYAFRVGAAANRRIAVFFTDITERKRVEAALRESEERQAFLLTLSDALRPLTESGEIERQATCLLGEHLEADRCFLSPVYDDGSGMCVREEYLRAGASSVLGDYTFAQFGEFVGPALHAGHTLAVEDVAALADLSADERASYAAVEIGAYLLVPLVREGRLAAFLTVNHRTPRPWSEADRAVARQTADRLWAARERGRAEAAVRASEACLAAAFESVPVGVALVDLAGATLIANTRYRQFLPSGLVPSRDPVDGARWHGWNASGRALDPQDFPAARAMRGESVVPGQEMRYTDDDGRAIWTSVATVPTRGDRGQVTGLVTAIADIDVVKRSTEAVRESEERLRTVLDGIGEQFYVLDADWRFLFVSRSALRVWGKEAASVEGRAFLDSFPKAGGSEVHAAHQRVKATGVAEHFEAVSPILGRWIEVDVRPTRQGGLSVAFRDIETRKRAEMALRETEERLRVLVAELQHRVRNILTVVRSVFARTAEMGGSVDEVADHFRGRLDSLARTQVVVTQYASGLVDLETLVRDELLSVGAGDAQVEGPEVMLSPVAAESIGLAVHELTTNAVKYGALKVPGASLSVQWCVNISNSDGGRLDLSWSEQGVPAVPVKPSRIGFGTELITEALPYRLGAETKLEFRGGGIRCLISVPLPDRSAAAEPMLRG